MNIYGIVREELTCKFLKRTGRFLIGSQIRKMVVNRVIVVKVVLLLICSVTAMKYFFDDMFQPSRH